jgi:hypothetical protein
LPWRYRTLNMARGAPCEEQAHQMKEENSRRYSTHVGAWPRPGCQAPLSQAQLSWHNRAVTLCWRRRPCVPHHEDVRSSEVTATVNRDKIHIPGTGRPNIQYRIFLVPIRSRGSTRLDKRTTTRTGSF